MQRWLAIVSAVILSGCVTTSGSDNVTSASVWVGKPLDSFVIKNGPPASTHKMTDGRSVVEWADVHGFADPGSPVLTLIAGNTPVQGVDRTNRERLGDHLALAAAVVAGR